MVFKPKQLDPNAVKPFTDTEVGTILESIDDKLNILLEGQSLLTGRVDRLEGKVDTVIETVADVKVEVTGFRDTAEQHEVRIKRLEPALAH